MATYDTGNPVPSDDPRDLYDNSKILDEFANSTSHTQTNRLGVEEKTLAGIRAESATGTYTKRTLPELQAITPPEGTSPAGRVTEGPRKGYYVWEDGAWEETEDPLDTVSNTSNPVFVPFERDSSISPEPTAFMAFIKNITVHGALDDKEYQVRFFQNNSDYFGDGPADGLIIVEFDAGAWTGERIVVNRNPPIVIDRSLSKQSIHIESNNTPGLSFTLLVSPTSLPTEGTPINAGASGNPGYSWKISRLCHELTTAGMQNQIVSIDDRLSLIEGGGLRALRKALLHAFRRVNIRFIGDSITWGRTLAANSAYLPNNGYLSDARDNLNSGSWVNILRKRLGETYVGGTLTEVLREDNSHSGIGYYENTNVVDVIGSEFSFVQFKTGDKIFSRAEVVPTSQAAALTGKYYDIVSVNAPNASTRPCSIEFDLVGDNLEVVYAQLTNSSAANTLIELYGNGVKLGEFSQYGSPAAFGKSHKFTFPSGHYRMQLINRSESTFLRFEGFKFIKRIKGANDGINGSSSATWLNRVPFSGSIQADDDFVFIQLGTNDRLRSTINETSPFILKNNLKEMVRLIAEKTDGKAHVILMCANAVTQNESNTETFKFDMRQVNKAIKDTADELGLSFISNYEMTMKFKIDGTPFLADNLHPDEFCHLAIGDYIWSLILNS